jgi:muramoyltetrapeptide carboxypeptidase
VHTQFGIPTIHADMVNGFNGLEDASSRSLHQALTGQRTEYNFEGYTLNRGGQSSGQLVGGNLSLIYAMQASPSELKTEGKILFIEDVSEYKYTVDRMMMNLKRSGKLKNLAGLIVGGFTATKEDTEVNYPMTMEEIIMEKVQEYNYPVCFHFPAGHQKINLALKLGMHYNLYVTDATCSLSEVADPHPVIPPATRYSDSIQSETPAFLPDSSFAKRQ